MPTVDLFPKEGPERERGEGLLIPSTRPFFPGPISRSVNFTQTPFPFLIFHLLFPVPVFQTPVSILYLQTPWGEGGGGGERVLRYRKGFMGTCSQSGYGFWGFCLKQGINFVTLS